MPCRSEAQCSRFAGAQVPAAREGGRGGGQHVLLPHLRGHRGPGRHRRPPAAKGDPYHTGRCLRCDGCCHLPSGPGRADAHRYILETVQRSPSLGQRPPCRAGCQTAAPAAPIQAVEDQISHFGQTPAQLFRRRHPRRGPPPPAATQPLLNAPDAMRILSVGVPPARRS